MAIVSIGGEQEDRLEFGLPFGILSCFIVVVASTVIAVRVMLLLSSSGRSSTRGGNGTGGIFEHLERMMALLLSSLPLKQLNTGLKSMSVLRPNHKLTAHGHHGIICRTRERMRPRPGDERERARRYDTIPMINQHHGNGEKRGSRGGRCYLR